MKEKILLVDDYPGIRDLLDATLRMNGYAVTLASNGQEALNALRSTGFDLVLLDLDMPVTDGWDALSQIVTCSLSLPLIFITERPGRERLAEQKGVTAVLGKPLDLPLLLGVMERAFAQSAGVRGKGSDPESSPLP